MLFLPSLLFATLTLAQNATVTWLAADDDPDFTPAYAGSIVSACPGTTVMAMACTSSAGSEAYAICGPQASVSPDLTPSPIPRLTLMIADLHLHHRPHLRRLRLRHHSARRKGLHIRVLRLQRDYSRVVRTFCQRFCPWEEDGYGYDDDAGCCRDYEQGCYDYCWG